MIGGMRHGKGVMTWFEVNKETKKPVEASYSGYWDLNRAEGSGTFTHTNGDVYKGEWIHNKANGRGVFTNSDGATFDGNWKNDAQHGFGRETWPDGSFFEGEY